MSGKARAEGMTAKRRKEIGKNAACQVMGKRYRAVQHGELTRHDATKDVFILDKIRAGMPDMDGAQERTVTPAVDNPYFAGGIEPPGDWLCNGRVYRF